MTWDEASKELQKNGVPVAILGYCKIGFDMGASNPNGEECNMCISTKRGPARIASDTIGDISAQYLQLEDGSGIGMNEADLYIRGLRNGLLKAAEIAETHQPQEFSAGCGTGWFIARTLREFAKTV